VMALPSRHWSRCNVAAEATWPWRDVTASHADDVAAETTWSRRDVVVESYCAIKVRIYDRSCDVRSELGCTCIISMYNG
jgi:hypothetical protein